jgi:hypothetical protein
MGAASWGQPAVPRRSRSRTAFARERLCLREHRSLFGPERQLLQTLGDLATQPASVFSS